MIKENHVDFHTFFFNFNVFHEIQKCGNKLSSLFL